jgi:hypothetical protein
MWVLSDKPVDVVEQLHHVADQLGRAKGRNDPHVVVIEAAICELNKLRRKLRERKKPEKDA